MRFTYSLRKMSKLFANSGDPDQTPRSGSALFAKDPFTGLPTTMGWVHSGYFENRIPDYIAAYEET